MPKEIERKFLLSKLPGYCAYVCNEYIEQSYLYSSDECSIRVRNTDNTYYELTTKFGGLISRTEINVPITRNAYLELSQDTTINSIFKTRYIYKFDNVKWEVDVFEINLKGLIIAECEIPSEDYDLVIPEEIENVLIKEVSGDSRYTNSELCKWKQREWSQEQYECEISS